MGCGLAGKSLHCFKGQVVFVQFMLPREVAFLSRNRGSSIHSGVNGTHPVAVSSMLCNVPLIFEKMLSIKQHSLKHLTA